MLMLSLELRLGSMLSIDRRPVYAVNVYSVDAVHGVTIQDLLVSSNQSINLYYRCYTTYDSMII